MNEKILRLANECETELAHLFKSIDDISYYNTSKILDNFRDERVSSTDFNPSGGYGYNDCGRDKADRLYARAFGCEDGFVRGNIISGTHAIAIALYGILRPGDTLLSVTGAPYDTIHKVIGIEDADGSLKDYGVDYKEISLTDSGEIDFEAVKNRVLEKDVKMIYIQRSKGYSSRRTLSACEITKFYTKIKKFSKAYVFVDNCYGEFVEDSEPCADILAGSLIKNPGGGMAEGGGYIVGTKVAVGLAAARLSVPGIGTEAGAAPPNITKNIIKGLFYAPHTVANALKTAHFAALLFKKLDYEVIPDPFEKRSDIIQIIRLGEPELLIKFCKGIQSGSPVDSYAAPIPGDMPGYTDKIIMAAGAFTQGSSIELSADAPIRPPYQVFLQGGLTYESGKYGICMAAEELLK